jgi:SSS family transporter
MQILTGSNIPKNSFLCKGIIMVYHALSHLNIAILFVYLAGMLAVGVYFAKKQKTTEDFFLGGRAIPWLAVGMSMFASLTSAVTYIGVPGSAFGENISLAVVCLVSPIVAPFLIFFIYPMYRRLNITTSYEYIFHRFGAAGRYSVSALFILARMGWMGTVIYAPALALSVMTGIELWLALVLMGLVATVYTALGGLAADIWTDVIQFVILIAGAIWVCFALVNTVPGGFYGIIETGRQAGKLHVFDWHFSLFEMSALAVAVSFFFQMMQDYGTDQVTVQRMMAIKDMKSTTKAILFNAANDFVVVAMLLFIGLGLYAYYQANPGLLPADIKPDRVFPFYIINALPNGISGLLVAAILAAAMSSMDSGINSVATVIMNDFLKPLHKHPLTDKDGVILARWLTLGLGVLSTALAFWISSIGEVIKAFATFMSLFNGPVLALFLLGMMTVRGKFSGWLVGVAAAIPVTLWLQYGIKAHWVYYFPGSFLTCFIVGYLASLAGKKKFVTV